MPNDYVDVQRLSEFPEVSQSERGSAIRLEENNLTSDVSRAVNSSCATGSRRSHKRKQARPEPTQELKANYKLPSSAYER